MTTSTQSPCVRATAPARNFMGNQFVYCVISQRARGLSIGVNMNPDKRCNFDCVYCEVDRRERGGARRVNIPEMSRELEEMLTLARDEGLQALPAYNRTPSDLLQLKEVALSGDGEPTLCPNFCEVVQTVTHLRARGRFPFFKIVLITNCTGLQLPNVRAGIEILTLRDEIWAKLDGGTQAYLDRVNRADISLAQVMENIVALGQERPIVIQSLFPLIHGTEPTADEIDEYLARLRELKDRETKIDLVQIYSAHRPARYSGCGHLPLRSLSAIARRVREETGLAAEVF
jgi:wyosine [tRNA(Phe)-imidazoG37] synthetase (radical SAM superfamily)